MRTTRECRSFYNRSHQYNSFQKAVGWRAPKQLVEHLSPQLCGGEIILDVGCGPGLVGQELRKKGWVGTLWGVDVAEERLKEAKRVLTYQICVQANAYYLPFKNQSFDVVLSNGMVGLTGVRSVKEMRRLVKAGGYLLCVAGEIKSMQWCRDRFRKASALLRRLQGAKLILEKDLGTGCAGTKYNDEHYILFLHQIVQAF